MTTPAGWYADPWQQAALRWFDGVQWTNALNHQPGWYADPWRQAASRWYDGYRWTTATQGPQSAALDRIAASPERTATEAAADRPAILRPLLGSADTVVVVDVETTGLGRSDRIVEIAMITLDEHGSLIEEFSTLINPHRDVGPTWIHGLTPSMLSSAPSFADVSSAIASRIDGAVVAAHNAPFDTRMLGAELSRIGIHSEWGRALDTLAATGRKLGAACTERGIMLADAHCALADAKATAELLVKVAAEIPTPGIAASTGIRSASPTRVQTRDSGATVHHAAPYLVELARNLAPDLDVAPYSILLDQALADLQLTGDERNELESLANELGLSKRDIDRAHRGFLDQLVDAALDDSVVTDEEIDRLTRVATLLELPSETVTSRTLEYRMIAGVLTLNPGLRVCFTGDGAVDLHGRPVTREALESAAVTAGMEPVGSVTMKKCNLLVVVDPASLSKKAQNAHRYGTPIATAGEFLDAILEHRELSVMTMRSAGVASVCERCGVSWTASRRSRVCKSCRTASGKLIDTEPEPTAVEPIRLITCTDCSQTSERLDDQALTGSRCIQCSQP